MPRRSIDWSDVWSEIALYAYAALAFAFLARFFTGMLLARRLLMRSSPAGPGFLESAMIAVPLTIGMTRPKILLPPEWREWDRQKLEAVLAHEGAHVRRRDGLISTLAGLNRCIFWFHPLAWWMERRLGLLAELACDESCVAALDNREEYARLLLDMARVVDRSDGRLRQHALTMAASSHLRRRIDSILKEGHKPSRGLSRTGWAAIALCGIPVVWGAGAVEFAAPPPLLRLDMPRPNAPKPPVLLAQAQPTPPAATAAPRLEFEVDSVRPASPRSLPPGVNGRAGGPPGGGNGCGQMRFTMDAGRVDIRCTSVVQLISYAFGIPQDRITGPDWMMIQPGPYVPGEGGPQFDIAAKLPEGASEDQVPEMFQNLLANRFKLAMHRGSKERPGYALVVDKGGLKLKPAPPEAVSSEAPHCPPGTPNCNVRNRGGIQTRTTRGPNADGSVGSTTTFSNPLLGTAIETAGPRGTRLEAPNTTLKGLAGLLPFDPVTDLTGLKGRYQVVLEIPFDLARLLNQSPLPTADQSGDAIQNGWRSALEKIGLRLEPRKVPVETIVVDHIERNPTPN